MSGRDDFIASDDDLDVEDGEYHPEPPSKRKRSDSESSAEDGHPARKRKTAGSEDDENEYEEKLSDDEEEEESFSVGDENGSSSEDDERLVRPETDQYTLKLYFESTQPWKTIYGSHLYNSTLDPLIRIGRANNQDANRILYDYFFTEEGIPTGTEITCQREKCKRSTKCDACNHCRDLRYHVIGLEWYVGRQCKDRVDMTYKLASLLSRLRSEHNLSPRPREWYREATRKIWELSVMAAEVVNVTY
jgi:hypothetical protein